MSDLDSIEQAASKAALQMVVISGGRADVGATTLAVQLAAAFAREALRVVLIDADLQFAGVAKNCGIQPTAGIGDVLAGKRTIHEALQRGPAGTQDLTAMPTPQG